MAETSRWERLWIYVVECAQLLYWAFFKPITLRRWLREIDPELEDTTNPFSLRERFGSNLRLRRYAGQVWWTTAILPTFFIVITGFLYPLLAGDTFKWGRSGQFVAGWWVGLLLARGVPKRLMNIANWFLGIVFILTVLWNTGFTPRLIENVLGYGALELINNLIPYFELIRPLAVGVAGGVAVGVAGGVAFGVAGGVAVGVAFGVAGGVAFGVAGGVAGGVAVGVAGGVAFGVAFGVAVGVAVGVSCILGVLRVYFWLPEVAWMLALSMFTLNGPYARWLRWLPPWFDQLIYLPLPFMDELIARAYKENQALARQTLDYLITSTNQQKAAASAITMIALNTLVDCENTGDIAALAGQLAWIPAPPPPELGIQLPQFVEVSQGVRAALEATSPYRQKELLTPPIAALHKIREGLAFASSLEATNFGGVVERWLGLLETARRTLEAQAHHSTEVPQVYLPGSALVPEAAATRFKGRQDIFRAIESLTLASQPPVLLLYGGRRTGKTSALNYLPRRIGPEIVPLVVDVQGLATAITLQGFAEGLAQQVVETARRARNLQLPLPEAQRFASDPFIALQRWMSEVEKVAGNKRFLLCLDEYERLDEVIAATHSRAPLNFLRHIMQHRSQWILLFSGAHLPEALPSYWSDYLINTQTLRLSYLSEADTRALIQQPVEGFPDIYEEAAIAEIVRLTRGHPYLTQLLCYEVVNQLNQTQRTRVCLDDIAVVVPRAFVAGTIYFRDFWDLSTTVAQHQVLAAVVQDRALSSPEKRVAETLVKAEVLEMRNGRYRFQVPLMALWVEQQIAGNGE